MDEKHALDRSFKIRSGSPELLDTNLRCMFIMRYKRLWIAVQHDTQASWTALSVSASVWWMKDSHTYLESLGGLLRPCRLTPAAGQLHAAGIGLYPEREQADGAMGFRVYLGFRVCRLIQKLEI